jgi:hypothetical protein
VLQRYLPFWPLFVITIGIGLTISWLYFRTNPDLYGQRYGAFKDPKKEVGDSKVLEALNIFSEKKIVENEIIVLRSLIDPEKVVRSLDLYAEVYNRDAYARGIIQKQFTCLVQGH